MPVTNQFGGRRGTCVAAATTVVLLVVGAVLIAMGARGGDAPPLPDAEASGRVTAPRTSPARDAAPRPGQTPKPVDFGPVLAGSAPLALDIPAIGVHSDTIVELGFANDGTIEVPADPSEPGWFAPGPSPGQFGPAVIAGHVDSVDGPAVFYRLGDLDTGDTVRVGRADASVATFVVDRVQVFRKADFPTREVYSNTTDRAELRLITCGGSYDEESGYLSNVVAFAHLVA